MAKIKNRMAKNMYGDGYEKEITLDNGEKYIIRNTMAKNMCGDGYEQEIVKENSDSNSDISFKLIILVGGLILMAILWWLFNNVDLILGLFF